MENAIDSVERVVKGRGGANIGLDKLGARCYLRALTGTQVVDHANLHSVFEQCVNQMRTDETRPSGYQGGTNLLRTRASRHNGRPPGATANHAQSWLTGSRINST